MKTRLVTLIARFACAAKRAFEKFVCEATLTSPRQRTWTAGTRRAWSSCSAWKELKRKPKFVNKTKQTRAKRPNFKEQFVVKKKYQNKILEQEFVAEFDYSPTTCNHTYRMVVLRKQVKVMQGQQKLFDDARSIEDRL